MPNPKQQQPSSQSDVKNNRMDLEKQEETLPSQQPSVAWHIWRTLQFTAFLGIAGLTYNFLRNPFEFNLSTQTTNPTEEARRRMQACPSTSYNYAQTYNVTSNDLLSPAINTFNQTGPASAAWLINTNPVRVQFGSIINAQNPYINPTDILFADNLNRNKGAPSVAVLSTGETVVVFDNGLQSFIQTKTNATAGKNEQQLNWSSAQGNNITPRVAALNGGQFTTAFSSQQLFGASAPQIYGRSFIQQSPTLISAMTTRDVRISQNNATNTLPDLTADVDTGTVAYVWQYKANSTAHNQIKFSIYDSNGNNKVPETIITDLDLNNIECTVPRITQLKGTDTYAVVLIGYDKTNIQYPYTPYLKLLNGTNGNVIKTVKLPYVLGSAYLQTTLTPVKDGFILAVGDQSFSGVPQNTIQKYDNQLNPVGNAIVMPGGFQQNPAVTTLNDDCIAMIWDQIYTRTGKSTQVVCAEPFLINTNKAPFAYTQNAGDVLINPFYIPQIYGQPDNIPLTLNFTIPPEAGVLAPDNIPGAASANFANGNLQLSANNRFDMNTMINCLRYFPAENYGNSFVLTSSLKQGTTQTTNEYYFIGTPINVPSSVVLKDINLQQGLAFTLTTHEINITDIDTPPGNITLVISNIQRCAFYNKDNPGQPITSFTFQHIIDEKIIILPDPLSTSDPVFQITVHDNNYIGNNLIGPFAPPINYRTDTPPEIILNEPFDMNQGDTVYLKYILKANGFQNGVTFKFVTIDNCVIEVYNSTSATWTNATQCTQNDLDQDWVRLTTAPNNEDKPIVLFTIEDYLQQPSAPQKLTVDSYNTKPSIDTSSVVFKKGKTTAINDNILSTSDKTTSAANIVYRFPTNHEAGYFTLNNKKTGHFTQSDVNQGNAVEFVKSSKKTSGSDTIPYTVSDGPFTISGNFTVTYDIKKTTSLQKFSAIARDPSITVPVGLVFSAVVAKSYQEISEHQKRRMNLFGARVAQAANIHGIVFYQPSIDAKERDGAASNDVDVLKDDFIGFLTTLVRAVDKRLPEDAFDGNPFENKDQREPPKIHKIQHKINAVNSHTWNRQMGCPQVTENLEDSYELDQIAVLFAHEIKKYTTIKNGFIPETIYTFMAGRYFDYNIYMNNDKAVFKQIENNIVNHLSGATGVKPAILPHMVKKFFTNYLFIEAPETTYRKDENKSNIEMSFL